MENKFNFKPGDPILIDTHVEGTVRQLGPPKGRVTVSIKERSGTVRYWCVNLDRCIPNTKAARTLYIK